MSKNHRKKKGVTWQSVSPSKDLVVVLQDDLKSWSLPCIEELLQSRDKVL